MIKYGLLLPDLGKIKSKDIKNFTEAALEAADPKYFTEACSSSGKHHPPEDQGLGGIVRHLKKGLAIVEQFARRALFSETEFDMAYSAFLLHDSCKNGIKWGDDTDYAHGYVAYEWLKRFRLENKFAKEQILDAVRYHMAPWAYRHVPWEHESFTKEQMNENIAELQRALTHPSRIELAVREADYWSSRKQISFLPGVNVIMPHDRPPEELAKGYMLDNDGPLLFTKTS